MTPAPRRPGTTPRHRQSALTGDPAGPPERAKFPPNGKVAEGIDPEKGAAEQHFRKHPSDYHADAAVGHMVSAMSEPDSAKRSESLQYAQIDATLSLRDAVLELAAVQRDIRDGRSKA